MNHVRAASRRDIGTKDTKEEEGRSYQQILAIKSIADLLLN
jgi:hypothetical protein